MATNQTTRPNFYEGQYLSAADLSTAVDYGRIEDARHLLGAHTWGIAAGLQPTEKDSPAGGDEVDLYIQPGYAWDGFGRPIILLNPVKIPAELFKSVPFIAGDNGVPPGRLFRVWLRYDESTSQQPGAGFEMCGAGDRSARIGETFTIEIGEFPDHTSHAPISIGGYTIDASEARQKFDPQTDPVVLYDESVPNQSFPADNPRARWLILLGVVRWSPSAIATEPGRFAKRLAVDIEFSNGLRRYIGVVAGSVEAANGVVRLHDRTKPYSTVGSKDLVWIEGDLRCEGDVKLFGKKVTFLNNLGSDNGVQLEFQRAGATLQTVIGDASSGNNSFAVGPLNGTTFTPTLVVRDDGKVGIGTTAADRPLTIQGASTAYLNIKGGVHEVLLGADDAGGIVSTMTEHDLRLRTVNHDRIWIKADGKVGVGTDAAVSTLQLAGDFTMGKMDRISPRVLPLGATMCWNDGKWLRLSQNFDWGKPVFGVHTPGLFAPGSLNVGGLGAWEDPGFGNVWIAGSVGIGTTTPRAALHVAAGAIMPSIGNGPASGIYFPPDPGGGAFDQAFIRYFAVSGETTKFLTGCGHDGDDSIGFFQAGAERLTIVNGRVGIGKPAPAVGLPGGGGLP